METRPHISFSEWQLWNSCQWRWMLDYLLGKRAPIYSHFMVFGTAIHDALEKMRDPKLEKIGETPSIEMLCTNFEVKFRKSYSNIHDKIKKPLSDKEVDGLVAAGIKIIEKINEVDEFKNAKVLFVEHPLLQRIDRSDGADIKFKGFIDLVIVLENKKGKKAVWIVDYKTCSWGWDREKRSDENLHAQLRLYKHFFSKEFNIDPKQIKTAFLLLKRSPAKNAPVADWFPVSAGPKTVARAVDSLNQAITGMRSNSYNKNRSQCVNKFGDTCPYYGSSECPADD